MTISEIGSFTVPDHFQATAAERKAIREYLGTRLPFDIELEWQLQTPPLRVIIHQAPQLLTRVTLDDILPEIRSCKDHEFVLGLAAHRKPVIVSLNDDSPHIACSAGSGAGKSTLAKVIAIQVLHRGGRVFFIDRKGSHKWAVGLPGVTYCLKADAMHGVLVGLAKLADQRNTEAFIRPEGWNPGERVLVIFEEINATIGLLKDYWDGIREKGEPTKSPAIQAFRELTYMGRSAKVHVFGVAQMLTAQAVGGPEARESFGIRCLARYSANNWKMLAPQCPMPRLSTEPGRWQVVVGNTVTATQVALIGTQQSRSFVLAGTPAPADELIPVPALVGVHGQLHESENVGLPGPEGVHGQPTWTTEESPVGELVIGLDAAAEVVGLPRDTFIKRRHRAGGTLPGETKVGKRPAWDETELKQWAASTAQ